MASRVNQWGPNETLDLCKLWKTFDTELRSIGPKKDLYNRISEELSKLGWNKSGPQIQKKIQNLKTWYREAKKSTGAQANHSELYLLVNELLNTRPFYNDLVSHASETQVTEEGNNDGSNEYASDEVMIINKIRHY